MICRELQPAALDSTLRYFYHRNSERARRQFLRLHPLFFGSVPHRPLNNDGGNSLMPLLYTSHLVRDRVVELVSRRHARMINMLDMEAFSESLRPDQPLRPVPCRSVSIFVPGGIPPPLPIHPILLMAQSNIPMELIFDSGFTGKDTSDTARIRLEETIRRLFGFLSNPQNWGSMPEQFDRMFVHPGGELYVSPSETYQALYRPAREWSNFRRCRYPSWTPTSQQLQYDLRPLHELTRSPIWLEISTKSKDSLFNCPFPDEPFQDRTGCENFVHMVERNKSLCVNKIMVGDPYGYRVYPTDEFLDSSKLAHGLQCLELPRPLYQTSIFLKLFCGLSDNGVGNENKGSGSPLADGTIRRKTTAAPCGIYCHS